MEFENPTTSPSSVTDEQRLLAQTKKVTLQPVNPFLKPDDAPDPIVVNETHSNIGKDAEDTSEGSSLLQPSAGSVKQMASPVRKPGRTLAIVFVATVVVVGVGIYIFTLMR